MIASNVLKVNKPVSFPRVIDPIRASLRPGVRINTYTLTKFLGKGAFGEVWEATGPKQSGIYAIKIGEKPSAVEKKMRELTVKAPVLQIRHPENPDQFRAIRRPHLNVVGHLEEGSVKAPGVPKTDFKVMEKIEGRTLYEMMFDPDWGENELKVFVIMRKMLLGLAFLHEQGIVHNDIKGLNVIVNNDWDVVLFDFGSAKKISESPTFGTPNYMPPERETYLFDAKTYPYSDIYSLGVLFHEMLTLKHPFDPGDSKEPKMFCDADNAVVKRNMKSGELAPDIDTFLPLIQCLLKGMLAIKPKERFQSCRQIVDLIDQIILEYI